MTGCGSPLRRRMTAMGMVELRVDHVVDGIQTHSETRRQTSRRQTRVSAALSASLTKICRDWFMFHVSCFMNVFRRAAAPSVSLIQIWRD